MMMMMTTMMMMRMTMMMITMMMMMMTMMMMTITCILIKTWLMGGRGAYRQEGRGRGDSRKPPERREVDMKTRTRDPVLPCNPFHTGSEGDSNPNQNKSLIVF